MSLPAVNIPPAIPALLQRIRAGGMGLPGGLKLWISLLSFGFLLAALVGHGRQLLQLSLDGQGWLWLLLGVGVSLLSLVANGFSLAVILRWLGLRPRWSELVRAYLETNLRKFLPGGIWHLTSRVQLLRGGEAPLAVPASAGLALAAVLLDPLLAAVAALALVAAGGWQNGLALLGVLPLALLWPRWLNPLLGRLERRKALELGLELEAAAAPPIRGYPWPPLLGQLLFVLLRFGGFACCVQAFDLSYSLSWGGWLALPWPGPPAWWCPVPPAAWEYLKLRCCYASALPFPRRRCWRLRSATGWW